VGLARRRRRVAIRPRPRRRVAAGRAARPFSTAPPTSAERRDPAHASGGRRDVPDGARALVQLLHPSGRPAGLRPARLRARGGPPARAAAARLDEPVRAAPPEARREAVGAASLRATRPEWVVRYGSQQWIDPGDPGARQAVLAAMLEVVYRYDIDAIHLDDYFYPYLEERTTAPRARGPPLPHVRETATIPFPDGARGSATARRRVARPRRLAARERVAVRARALRQRQGAQAVGGGRHQPVRHLAPRLPARRDRARRVREIFADSRRWWREGWLDYMVPQLYWHSDGEQSRNQRLDAWWRAENVRGRHLWPGMLTMRVATAPTAGRPPRSSGRSAATARRARARASRRGTCTSASSRCSRRRRAGSATGSRPACTPRRPSRRRVPWLGQRRAVGAARRVVHRGRGAGRDAHAVRARAAPAGGSCSGATRPGAWTGARTLPATSAVPLAFSDGSRPTAVAVRPVSPTGVEGAPLVLAPVPAPAAVGASPDR
jgi:hypothetical protein